MIDFIAFKAMEFYSEDMPPILDMPEFFPADVVGKYGTFRDVRSDADPKVCPTLWVPRENTFIRAIVPSKSYDYKMRGDFSLHEFIVNGRHCGIIFNVALVPYFMPLRFREGAIVQIVRVK